MELDKQVKNKPLRNEKGQLLPGNTANPYGRPIGQSLKEYRREYFAKLTPAQKEKFLKEISPDLQWRMAEGNPETDSNHKITGDVLISFDESFKERYEKK